MAPPPVNPASTSSSERGAESPEFQSAALFDLVSGIGVRGYDDLLAAHWCVPDRLHARERFDRARFTRSSVSRSDPPAVHILAGGGRLEHRRRTKIRQPSTVIVVGAGSVREARRIATTPVRVPHLDRPADAPVAGEDARPGFRKRLKAAWEWLRDRWRLAKV